MSQSNSTTLLADADSVILKDAIGKLVVGQPLTEHEMSAAFYDLMTGQANQAQIAAFLVALRMKGESIEEIVGAVKTMRQLMVPVHLQSTQNTIDIVGTGGDGANLINVSTAASIVCAAAGLKVAKHGNRSVSSKSGSADLLETAGVVLNLSPQQVAQCVDELGVGFMFAMQHHPAMKYAAPVRKALGIRTVFNLLGPMCNPAGVTNQLIGVYDDKWCRPVVEVLHRLGAPKVMAVHSFDGLDELSLAGPTHVVELKDDGIQEYQLNPEDVGLKATAISVLRVKDANDSLVILKNAFSKKRDEVGTVAANMIAYNAGMALYVGGKTLNKKQGVELALDVIYGGQAQEKLDNLVEFTKILATGV